MKKLLSIVLIAMIATVVCCKDPNKPGVTPNPTPDPKPPTPNPDPNQPTTPEITASDFINAFGTNKGDIPASMAAKTMEKGSMHPGSNITFEKRKIVSYNDKDGTFTMHFKGERTKANNTKEAFDKDFSFTEFIHPLKGKIVQSVNANDFKLSLDEGIEHNSSLDKYIEELNNNIENNKMLKSLTFTLSDGTSTILLGTHTNYILKATAKKTNDNKIQIVPKVPYFRLDKGTTTEVEEDESVVSFTTLTQQLTKDYFSKNDVFKYILDKLGNDSAIKADPTVFASSFYAFAKTANATPGNIFSDEFINAIKVYQDRYKDGGEGKHLKLDIGYGVNRPKTGGVDADDYKGSLKINLCIATNEEIADQASIVSSKFIEKSSGFASIPDDAALAQKKHLFFNLVEKAPPLSDTQKQEWEKKAFPENYFLLRVDENGQATVNGNIFNPANIPFHLCVNSSETNPSSYLGCAEFGSSKTRNGKKIWIENIQLKKAAGSKDMDVLVTLKGSRSEPLKITISPY